MKNIKQLVVSFVLFCTLIISTTLWSQEWMQQCSSPGNDAYFQIWDIDSSNSIYCTTKYSNSILLSDTLFYHEDYNDNIAIAIYNTDGTLDRATDIVPINTGWLDDYFLGAANNGNYYVTAGFLQRVFINGTAINHGGYPVLTFDLFLAKLDIDNDLVWAKTISGNHHDNISGFVVGEDGSLYLVVEHEGASTVGYLGQDTVDYSERLHVVLKTNSEGEIQWRKEINHGGYFYAHNSFELNNGNLFITGRTSEDIEVDGVIIEFGDEVSYSSKTFTLEFDTDGSLISGLIISTNIFFRHIIAGPDNDLFFSTYLSAHENYFGHDTIYEPEDTSVSLIGRMTKTFNPIWYKTVRKRGPGGSYFGITSNSDSLFAAISCFYKFVFDGQLFEFGMPRKLLLMTFDHNGEWDYTKMFRSESENGLAGLKLNHCNDLIMSGYFRGQTWFADDTLTSDSIDFRDSFLTKINRWGDLEFSIGNDTVLKITDGLYIEAPDDFLSYRWSTGDTTKSIFINCEDLGTGVHSIWCNATRINNCYLSDTLILEIYDNTGIQEGKFNAFSISPNPAQNQISITTTNEIKINQLNIYNQLGQKVLHIENPSETIDISSIGKGLFVVEVVSDGEMYSSKLIKK